MEVQVLFRPPEVGFKPTFLVARSAGVDVRGTLLYGLDMAEQGEKSPTPFSKYEEVAPIAEECEELVAEYVRRLEEVGTPFEYIELPHWNYGEKGTKLPLLPEELKDRVITDEGIKGVIAWVEGFWVPTTGYLVTTASSRLGLMQELPGYLVGSDQYSVYFSEPFPAERGKLYCIGMSHQTDGSDYYHPVTTTFHRINPADYDDVSRAIKSMEQFAETLDLHARRAAGEKLPGWQD